MSKNSKETQDEIKIKYSWQFWCLVSVFIAMIVVIILLATLSIKALVQDIQLLSYKNKVEGTVSIVEFNGEKHEYDEVGDGMREKFDEVRHTIAFDKETSGYSQYEYHAKDIIASEKNIGDRYIVLFNNIENPKLIQKEDIIVDNIILFLFFALVIIVIVLRKKLYMWLTKISKKFETFI